MRAGSIVIWDQKTIHGSSPNNSNNFRAAQFVKMWIRTDPLINLPSLKKRAATLKLMMFENDFKEEEINETGKQVFCLNPVAGNKTPKEEKKEKKNSGRLQGSGW